MFENYRLTVFRAVAAERSFRRAAEQLYLTQPAVTQQIKALEELVGLPLFDRSGREVTLTLAGGILLKYAQQSGALLEQAAVELAALKGQVSGTLRIAASTTIAQYILPPLLASAFSALASPLCTWSSIAATPNRSRMQSLLAEPASVLWKGPRTRVSCARRSGSRTSWSCWCLPATNGLENALSLCSKASPRHLSAQCAKRGSGTREVIETTLEAAGLPARDLHIAMELNSTEAILGCIESGVGVGFVSRTAIHRQLSLVHASHRIRSKHRHPTRSLTPDAGRTRTDGFFTASAQCLGLLRQHRMQMRRAPARR